MTAVLVAVPLADALGLPLIGKDLIKEALFDALGVATWVRASLPMRNLPDNH